MKEWGVSPNRKSRMKKLLSLLITCLTFCAPVFAAPLKIGVVTDMSGHMAFWGRQTRLGAEIARDEIAAQGGSVTLVFGDHQLQAKSAASEAQKLINIDKVDAIYSEFTGPSIASAPIAREAGVLFMYSAVAVSALSANPDAFKTFMDYRVSCRKIVEHWKTQGVARIGMLKPNSEFGELCLQGAKAADPGIIEEAFNPGDELQTQVFSLKNQAVQAIINPGYEPDHLRMFKALQSYRFSPFLSMQEDDISSASKNAFPDLVRLATFFGFEDVSPKLQGLMKQRDAWNSSHSHVAAGLAYLHIKQIYFALSRCPERKIQCQKEEMAGSPADASMGFLGFKDRVAQFTVPLKRWENGRSVSVSTGH